MNYKCGHPAATINRLFGNSHLLLSCEKNKALRHFDEWIITVQMQYTDSSGTTRFYKDPIKTDILIPTAAWNLEAAYIYYRNKLRIFHMPLIRMPLMINDENDLTRHFVKWRLENGI